MGSLSLFPSSSLLGVAAAVLLIIMATIFLSRAAKGRRRVATDHQETSRANSSLEETESPKPDHEETNCGSSSLDEKTEPSNPREDVGVPDIFLSHSGKQKPFVERLYENLSANHTVFFDQHTLPKGMPFPSRIEQAARGCKIGIVVLSEEFLTSKWPMKELEMLILQKGPEPYVLPLFYRLNPGDLKSPEKLLKWRCVWKEMGDENSAQRWEEAVKALKHFNGEVFVQGTSEGAYIKKVVHRICTRIPCHVPYDCSSIKGQSRLVEEIAAKFKHFDASQACMVGLHGVGGLGKTTLCKVMVNYYSSHYHGKSFLIEFPSLGGGGDSSTIASECKKALNKLTAASYEHLLNKVDSFDEVVKLMRDRVGCHDVFLAIDNVWESSLEEAKRVLGVCFSANSKILMTSRSEQVLKDVLMVRGHDINASVAPLPAPEREEAFEIFQETFESYDLSALVDSNQMDRVLARCRFSGSYHALALKALAKYVKRVCMTADSEGIKHHLFCALEEISFEDLSDVEKVIGLSYDNLPEQKKNMFLDIVACLVQNWDHRCTYAKAQEWISLLHWKFPESKVTMLINELSLDGLIQIEVNEDGTKEIGLHDLYLELACREMASSPRFLTEDTTESLEKIEWENLEIAILVGIESAPSLFEKLQQCKCPKLKLLIARDRVIKSGNWLDSMPSLSVLVLDCLGPQKGTRKNLGNLRRIGRVDASRILHLNGLVNLQKLKLKECSFVEAIAGLDALGNLKKLKVNDCKRLKSLDGLSGLVQLQDLQVLYCDSLQKLPDVSSLTCLERLELVENNAMKEAGGEYLSSTLKHLHISRCGSLRSCPSLVEGMHLKTLETGCAHHINSLPKLPNLHTCLKHLDINDWQSTIKKIEVGCFTNLKDLAVRNCGALKEIVGDLSALRRLEEISIEGCPSLKKLNVGCPSLKRLQVWSCKALEKIIGDVKAPPSLERISIGECQSLKKLEGIAGSGYDSIGIDNLYKVAVFQRSVYEETFSRNSMLKVRIAEEWPSLKASRRW